MSQFYREEEPTMNPLELTAQRALERLNRIDECDDIEAKSTEHGLGDAIFKSVCAFANSQNGGYVLCGVKKVDTLYEKEYEPLNVYDADNLQKDLQTGLDQFVGKIHLEFVSEKVRGCNLVLVRVFPTPPQPLHVHFKKLGYPNGVYLRRGSVD